MYIVKQPIKVALIGYGFGGSIFHAPIIQAVQGLELSVVYTSNEAKVKEAWPNVKVTQRLDDIWDDPEIGMVAISTPNSTHKELIRIAIEAGKHVVVDKPFVIHSTDGEQLIRLAEEKGVLLSVYHNRRWDSDFLTVKKLIEDGKLGEVLSYEARYDRYRPTAKDRWKEKSELGGGTLYDLGSHLIDQALTLFGRPETVTADCGVQREGSEGTDYFLLSLGYGRNRVILQGGSFVRKKGPKYVVHGRLASFIKSGEDTQERTLIKGGSPNDAGYGEEDPAHYGSLHFEEEDSGEKVLAENGRYHRFYEMMRDAIIGGGPVPVRPEEALDVIRVIELAELSHKEGRTIKFA